ncbi:MAG: photosystem II protein PsbQ [Xenococcaceae cyanobacterium]
MAIFRSILPLILVLVTTLLVSCGGAVAKAPPTYTPAKLQVIQAYAIPVKEAKEKFSTLQNFIENEDWVDTRSFIHGPLGGLRKEMSTLSRSLLPDDQKQAEQLSKEIFAHFEKLDAAAQEQDLGAVVGQFKAASKDLDSFLDLIPAA